MAGEEVLGPGHVLHRHQPPRRVVLEDPVHEHERVLGGNLADEPSDLAGAHAGRGPRRVRARRREEALSPAATRPGGEKAYGLGVAGAGAGAAAAAAGLAFSASSAFTMTSRVMSKSLLIV